MHSPTARPRLRRHRPFGALVLAVGLLLGAQTAYAFFSESRAPDEPTSISSIQGCEPTCTGSCSYNQYENGDVCGYGCFCCGCQTISASLNYWSMSGAQCFENSGAECSCFLGDMVWCGYYSGTSATTQSDCG